MTENEMLKIAVHCLGVQAEQEVCEECDIYGNCHTDCKDVTVVAIKALKEIQQYREIGTVEECKTAMELQKHLKGADNNLYKVLVKCSEYERIGTAEECRGAVEKQKPKKPHRNYKKFSGLWCKCGWYLGQKQCLDIKYCPNCGQAIRWEESEEE